MRDAEWNMIDCKEDFSVHALASQNVFFFYWCLHILAYIINGKQNKNLKDPEL